MHQLSANEILENHIFTLFIKFIKIEYNLKCIIIIIIINRDIYVDE